MAGSDAETKRSARAPSVLVVGSGPEFIQRCRQAAPAGMLVGGASLADCAKQAARLRPHVIVVTADVRAFDGARLEELGQAVGARVTCFASEAVPDAELSRRLGVAIAEVARRRAGSSAD